MRDIRSDPAHLGGISLDFAGIPPRRDENFPYEHSQVIQPGKVRYTLEFFPDSISTWLRRIPP